MYIRLCQFQSRQRFSESRCFVCPYLADEVNQCCGSPTGLGRLRESVHHEARNQLVAAMKWSIAVCSVIALLNYQLLFGKPLEHGHHRCVRQFTMYRERFVHLPNSLWFRGIPQMIHYRTLEFA